MPRGAAIGLERSCAPAPAQGPDHLRSGPASPGIERVEARLAGGGYAPHRHDTYALGVTLAGVQAFRYRGAARASLPGELFVLHPDELHDGRPGSDAALRYRILYVDPGLIRSALGGRRALPFVRAAVSRDPGLARAIAAGLDDLDQPLEDLAHDAVIQGLADALAAADPSTAIRRVSASHSRAVARARERLDAAGTKAVASAELEAITGLTRYALARQFRACLGTTPHRYLVLRRLDRARALIRSGASLVDAALASGFADQSHLTRHFMRAYGVSPGRWADLTAP
ncbi:MAG: AraC family transcriptional regulator [Alphaproteobacteria bacterium]|nr:AraC family transcriptional regulator [Alphaproteobacteria bacterium]